MRLYILQQYKYSLGVTWYTGKIEIIKEIETVDRMLPKRCLLWCYGGLSDGFFW